MTITYNKHAPARMHERGICRNEVETTLQILLKESRQVMAGLNLGVSLSGQVQSSCCASLVKGKRLCW
jgi:hypothetical protein